ncbi:Rof transcriptional antiterminator [Nitrosomonas nitrosa]|jgi:Rho-binding antiterminator|uniref:Rho-binding antiterminator n=1 Tax=Nitrosomonas nitrosa TaxID=52442 RepID=A0A8H8YZ25_9PROT|nr:Rho-binding antiterminator [Nitrosomonas nitrosa]MCO6434167.1 Rho-binding antiterminator [Nitrosomonas nitrosa]PTQ90589.1 Rof transcriptional antiterminator [Nitrosomonas nitrosa]CAE6490145.1 Rho-binding antiterminator [Nitrosomonas nitrosa]HNP51856.1 Rho-binding antiterminator [Nitrosomonas nitrosa]
MTQPIIDCELHDYIEVACMYGYQVRLVLKNQQIIEGQAKDIVTTAEKREFLVIENEQGRQQVELITLDKMQVLTTNAKFNEISF